MMHPVNRIGPVAALEPLHLALAQMQQAGGFAYAQPPACRIFHHSHSLQLFLTHRHHPCRVTESRCSYGVTLSWSIYSGGSCAVTPTTPQGTTPAPITPVSPGAPPPPAGTTPPPSPGANAGAPTTPGGPTPAPSAQTASPSPSSTPPIVTVLQADGLARKMGVLPDDKGNWAYDNWRILFVKSTESGTTIETKSRFLSTKLLLDGGAVSGYALFQLDGTLVCSGNAAAYQGNITLDDFSKLNAETLKATQLI